MSYSDYINDDPTWMSLAEKRIDCPLEFTAACPSERPPSTYYCYSATLQTIEICPIGSCDRCGRILSIKHHLRQGLLSIKAVLDRDSPGVRVVLSVLITPCDERGFYCVHYRDIPGNIRAGVPFYIHIVTHPASSMPWFAEGAIPPLLFPI